MAISEWANKDSIDKVLPTIIRFGQRGLEDDLRIRPMEYHPTTATVTAGSDYLALPADYLELIYFQLILGTTRYPLDIRLSAREMNHFRIGTADTGMPQFVARMADNLYFDCLTDQTYTRDWMYYRRLPVLTSSTVVPEGGVAPNSNYWSESAEEAILFSCLNKLSLYVTGIPESDKKKWSDAYITAIEALKFREARETTGGHTLRSANWI